MTVEYDERDERDAVNDRIDAVLAIVPANVPAEELDDARSYVQETILIIDDQILEIRKQLADAEERLDETGVAADRAWWKRANLALLYKTRERQRLQFILSGIGRRIKDIHNRTADSDRDKFIEAARGMLPEKTYRAIWRAVKAEP